MPFGDKSRPGFTQTSIRRVPLLLVGLACAVLPRPAGASTVYVDCSGATPGAFTSVNAALDSLSTPPAVNDWHYVLLKSDCTENVVITGGRRVWIAPEGSQCPYSGCTQGPLLRITAAAAGAAVVDISGPQDVTLVHLALSGGSTGLNASGNASVTAFDVSAEDNTGAGFTAVQGASLALYEGGARRNGWYGLVVGTGGAASLSGQQSWLHDQPIVLSGNRGGIWVDRGSLVGVAGIRIEGNASLGLTAFGGDVSFGAYTGETIVQDNQGGGFFLSEGSQASLWRSGTGVTTIRGNGPFGVYVEKNSHASIFEYLVEGHAGVGVDVVMGSQVHLQGARVRANGSSQMGSAGVRLDGNSQVFLDRAEVTGNLGPGVVADLNSSIDARAVTLSGNAREGIRVVGGSYLALGSASSLLDRFPVTCDSLSHVISDQVSPSLLCRNVTRARQTRPIRPPQP